MLLRSAASLICRLRRHFFFVALVLAGCSKEQPKTASYGPEADANAREIEVAASTISESSKPAKIPAGPAIPAGLQIVLKGTIRSADKKVAPPSALAAQISRIENERPVFYNGGTAYSTPSDDGVTYELRLDAPKEAGHYTVEILHGGSGLIVAQGEIDVE